MRKQAAMPVGATRRADAASIEGPDAPAPTGAVREPPTVYTSVSDAIRISSGGRPFSPRGDTTPPTAFVIVRIPPDRVPALHCRPEIVRAREQF